MALPSHVASRVKTAQSNPSVAVRNQVRNRLQAMGVPAVLAQGIASQTAVRDQVDAVVAYCRTLKRG